MTKQKGIILALGGLMMLGFAGGARADLHMTYKQQAAISPSGISLRDIAVNKNPGSPYYGYVYAANATTAKVHILKPSREADGTGSAGLVDTGLTITPSSGANNTFGLAVGADDIVWLGNYTSGNIETAPPVPAAPATDVVSHKQFAVTGGIRGIGLAGTLSDAHVWIQTNNVRAKYWTGNTSAWDVTGTFSEQKDVDLKTEISANLQVGYGLGVDHTGTAYVGLTYNASGAAAPLIAKIGTDGKIDASWGGKRPPFTSIANSLADAEVVEDPRLPGGGYVYWGGRQTTGGANKRLVHRYRLDNGEWLDSFGPAAATGFNPPTDATYTVLDVDNAASPHYFTADDKGNLYLNSGNQATVTKVAASQPFLVASGAKTSAGDIIKSSPTVFVDGIAYFGANDGKLYAYTVADGNPVAGFPVNVAGELEQPNERILGRPAVYYADVDGAGLKKYIYFTTSHGFICRVDADGGNLKYNLVSLNSGGVSATPAVLADGTVYAGLYDGTAARVYKFNADLSDFMQSSALGYGNMSSVAVAGNNVFVGLTATASRRLAVLNANSLDVLTTFDGEQVSAPPYVNHGAMYFGTWQGNFYKVNAATGALDASFGDEGGVDLGAPITTTPFVPQYGPFLVPTDEGKVWTVQQDHGGHQVFFDTGQTEDPIGGLVATFDCLAFGTASGAFYVVPSSYAIGSDHSHAQVYRGHGAFSGAPAYNRGNAEDPTSWRFVAGSEDGNVYTFPPMPPMNRPL